MPRHIPPEVERAVAERGSLTDKLLVALIEAVNEQDTIHDDLGDISRQLEQLSTGLSVLVENAAFRR